MVLGLSPVLGTCSGPGPPEATDLLDRGALEDPGGDRHEDAEAAGGATDSTAASSGRRRGVDSEELVGLGELGLLPTLIQALSPGIDCDPGDPFSNCQ